MKKEIPVRYKKEDGPELRFQSGDVVYRFSEDSMNQLKRYVVESAHPGEIYLVRRLDDQGLKSGDIVRMSSAVSKHLSKDLLVTNLIAVDKDPLE